MRKALLHIFVLSLLLNIGLAHAAILPHEAIVGTSVQKEEQLYKLAASGNEGNSQLYKDITITDWDEYDEFDIDEPNSSKAYFPAVSPVKENHLAVCYSFQSDKGKIYTSLNFSRLPRHNYISLRVLRIWFLFFNRTNWLLLAVKTLIKNIKHKSWTSSSCCLASVRC